MKRTVKAWRLLGPKIEGDARRLLADGLAETRARALALLPDLQLVGPRGHPPRPSNKPLCVKRGPFRMGSDQDVWAFDNDRTAHLVELKPFLIDSCPITNREFIDFTDAGGYAQPRYWRREGWAAHPIAMRNMFV